MSIKAVRRRLEITEQTYYRWRKEYGGLKVDQGKRPEQLERENSQLERLLANAHLDNAILE
jgi:transposase-like protein